MNSHWSSLAAKHSTKSSQDVCLSSVSYFNWHLLGLLKHFLVMVMSGLESRRMSGRPGKSRAGFEESASIHNIQISSQCLKYSHHISPVFTSHHNVSIHLFSHGSLSRQGTGDLSQRHLPELRHLFSGSSLADTYRYILTLSCRDQ